MTSINHRLLILISAVLLLAANLLGQSPEPVPFISQPLVPTTVAPGSGALTIIVNGAGFTANSIVHWNGNALTTTFVSANQLTADILAADLTTATTAAVAVVNPKVGGGSVRSNIVYFPVATMIATVSLSQLSTLVGNSPLDVVTGDFNTDGALDVAVANTGSGTISIRLGNGNGTFTTIPDVTGLVAPGALATGDFNADGILDLAVARPLGTTVTICLGNGDGTFTAMTPMTTNANPSGIVSADLDGDGFLDLAIAGQGGAGPTPAVSIFRGNGDGTFLARVDYPTQTNCRSIAAGDFNGDGVLDLVAGNSGSNTVSFLRGNGNGTFQAAVNLATALGVPYSVTAADFNGDGFLDFAVALRSTNLVSVSLGNGAGTFLAALDSPTGTQPTSMGAQDFNGDGILDLAITNQSANAVTIQLGNGDGTFQAISASSVFAQPLGIASGDFDGDGRLDLASVTSGGVGLYIMLQAPPAPEVQLSTTSHNFGAQLVNTTSAAQPVTLTNAGTATMFITSFNVQVSTGDSTPSLDFSQNNNCGFSLSASASCTINVLFTPTSLGPLSAVVKIASSNAPGSPHFITLSGIGISDGAVGGLPANFDFGDQAVGSTSPAHTFTLNNTGAGTLGISNIAVTGDFAIVTVGGDCGATVAATTGCNIGVKFGPLSSGASGGTLTITHDGAGSPAVVILTGNGLVVDPVAFINQPLVPTSVAPGSGPLTLTVNGTGFTANSLVHWNGNPRTTAFVNSGQVTADILAVDVASPTTAEVAVDNPKPGGGSIRSNIVFFHATNPASSVSLARTDLPTGTTPYGVTAADFNADGKSDLAVANNGSDTISVFIGNGNGTFQAAVDYVTGPKPYAVTTGDFNEDGVADLAAPNFNSAGPGSVSVLLGNGNGTFQPRVDYATTNASIGVATADLNADGKLDLAVTNLAFTNSLSILLGNGDGTFQTRVNYDAGIFPFSVVPGDLNGDGKLDLALAVSGTGSGTTTSVLLGNGDGTFQPATTLTVGVSPYSVAPVDLNGDGNLDLAVTNGGVSSVSILLGIGGGTFQTHVTYATGLAPYAVTPGDFNGDGKIDLAFSNQASSTVSILLGNGDGTLQADVQYSAGGVPFYLAAGDFDADGKLDLAVSNAASNTVSVLLQTGALLGPTPYLSQADSPFFASIQAGTTYLETFEDGLLNTPGVTASAGGPIGPSGLTDSVDGDDGTIDGFGTAGSSFFSGSGPTGITFTFSDTALGNFPTQAGIVWTDAGGGATVTFEAFDALGASLGVVGPVAIADGSNSGTTAEDRFFGAVNPAGISAIHISNSSGGIEVDHLQYGVFPAAPAPVVQLSTTSIDFGSLPVGDISTPSVLVTLTNTGTGPLIISSSGLTGANPGAFNENNGCFGTIQPDFNCTIDLRFEPNAVGPLSASVTIVSNAPGSPHTVDLTGTGTSAGAPAILLSTGSVNFTGNPLNLTCPTKPVTITNTGDVPLDIVSISATGLFSVTHNCPATLGVEASCVANVKFSPTVVGPANGTLTITTNPATTGNTVNLTGNGTPACALLAKVRSVTVLRGTDVQDFAVEDAKPSCSPVALNLTCSVDNPAACLLSPAVIAPSGASTLKVSNLKRVGSDALQITVTSTSEFRTASELVTVRFADFAFTKSPDSSTVAAGGATSYALAIRPVNGLAGNLALACSGAPRGATCAVEPSSVSLDGTSLAQVKVKVSTAGRAGALPVFNLPSDWPWHAVPLLLGLMALLAVAAPFRAAHAGLKPGATRLVLATIMLAMLAWASCGGGGGSMNLGSNGTPAGTYTLTITGTYSSATGATPGTLANSTTVSLRVN